MRVEDLVNIYVVVCISLIWTIVLIGVWEIRHYD